VAHARDCKLITSWLSVSNLAFSYPEREVLSGLQLEMDDERPILTVVGESGVGKTTLAKLLAGHLRPRAGSITVCGDAVDGPSVARPVVFQDHNLFPWLSVRDNIAFGLRCLGISDFKIREKVDGWIERLRLEGAERDYPSMLSGGMKQRVGLARAMAVDPKCVIMDEPFSALDHGMRETLCSVVSSLVGNGTRFVIVTHDLSDAVFLGTRVCALLEHDRSICIDNKDPPHPRPVSIRDTAVFTDQVEKLRKILSGDVAQQRDSSS